MGLRVSRCKSLSTGRFCWLIHTRSSSKHVPPCGSTERWSLPTLPYRRRIWRELIIMMDGTYRLNRKHRKHERLLVKSVQGKRWRTVPKERGMKGKFSIQVSKSNSSILKSQRDECVSSDKLKVLGGRRNVNIPQHIIIIAGGQMHKPKTKRSTQS